MTTRTESASHKPRKRTPRRICYLTLEPAEPNNEAKHRGIIKASWFIDGLLIGLIVLNVLAVILESVPSIEARFARAFLWFERVSVAVFTIEYIIRLWSAVEENEETAKKPWRARLSYALRPLSIADLLAILPFYLSALINIDLRMLRALRLLRVLKLSRYSTSIGLLLDALRSEARAIAAAIFILSLLVLIAASFAYVAEQHVQPEAFGTIPDALWWAVITMTTVGFGDVVPMTPFGKVIGSIIAVIGIGMVALPAGLLAAAFSEQLHLRDHRFETEVEARLVDGKISKQERADLEEIRKRLGLRSAEADMILHNVLREARIEPPSCPHCGKPLMKEVPISTLRARRHSGKGLLGS
ncbi:MAG: potassium channel family protein [Pseudomonadota bacterium]